jgi:hypothetical protein
MNNVRKRMNHILGGSSFFDSCRKKRGIFPDTVYDPVEAKGGRPYAGSSPCCVSGTCRGCTPCWYTMGRCAIRHRSHSAGPSGAGGASFRGDYAGLGENRSLSGGAGKLEWLADRPHPSCGAESRPADLPARRGRGLSEDPPSPELTPEEVLLRQERQTALQAALGSYPPVRASVLPKILLSALHRPDCLGVGAYGAGGGGTAIPAETAAAEIAGR